MRSVGVSMAGLLVLVGVAFRHSVRALKGGFFNINNVYFVGQDAIVLALFFLIWLAAATPVRGRAAALADLARRAAGRADRRFAVAIALVTAIAVVAGAALIFHGVRLSGDEFFAIFDAHIFAAGRLTAPIPAEWRPYAHALQPMFVAVTPNAAAWSSVDLPLDAALLSAFVQFGEPELLGALLASAALFLLWRLARNLWPDRPDAAVVATSLLALSPQFLVTAMTPYAMTAYLTFALAWLTLFLSRRPAAQVLAGVTAFAACGLHKWLFAPLFAAPFLLWSWRAGRRREAAAAAVVFAASIAFWIAWPSLESIILKAPPSSTGLTELDQVVRHASWNGGVQIMAENLIRFVVWQNPATLPLAVAGGWLALRRPHGIEAALAAGPLIAIALLTVFFPFQVHGWGFRYLHSWLGSLALLAAAAWIRMTPPGDAKAATAAATPVLIAALAGALIVMPLQLQMVSRDLAHLAAVSNEISHAPADVVLVDTASDPFGVDFVRNDPFLVGRPKVMQADQLSGNEIADLAARRRVVWFTLKGGEACFAPIVIGGTPTAKCRPVPATFWPE